MSRVLQKDVVCESELQLPDRLAGFADNSCRDCRDQVVKHVLQALRLAVPFSCIVYLLLMQTQLKLPAPILFNRLWMFVAVLLQTQLICKSSQNSFQL